MTPSWFHSETWWSIADSRHQQQGSNTTAHDRVTTAAPFIPLHATMLFPSQTQHAPLSASFDFQLRCLTGNITAAVSHVQIKHLPVLILLQIPRGIIWTRCKFLCRRDRKLCCTLFHTKPPPYFDAWWVKHSAVVGFAFQSLDASLRNNVSLPPDNTLAVAEPLPKWNNW